MGLKSTVEEVDAVTRILTVSIPAEEVEREIDAEIRNIGQNVRVKGFRPGKAPQKLVEQQHGNRVRLEVAHRMISSSLNDIVREHDFEMVGDPEIDISNFTPGEALEYKASISLFPSPEITGYDSFVVEVPKREIQNEDVDRVLEQVRESRAVPRKLEFRNVAQKGDVVEATVEVLEEGQESSRPEPVTVVLGAGNIPEELDDGIIGMETGSTKDIPGKLPAQPSGDEEPEAKPVTFRVTLQSLAERELPELNDEFAKEAGLGVETLLELRMKVREKLEEEAKSSEKGDVQVAILDQLLERNQFVVPQVMIDNEIRNLLGRSGLVDPRKTDLSKISVEPFREQLGDTASKRVRSAVIVDKIAELENLQAKREEIESALANLAEENQLPLDDVKEYFSDTNRALNFALEQTRNKVLEFLASRAEVRYTEIERQEEAAETKPSE